MQHIFLICIIRLRQRLGQQRLRLQTVLNYKKVIESWATGITSCYDNLRSLFHLFFLFPSTHAYCDDECNEATNIALHRHARFGQSWRQQETGCRGRSRVEDFAWLADCLAVSYWLSVCLALELPVKRLQLNNS